MVSVKPHHLFKINKPIKKMTNQTALTINKKVVVPTQNILYLQASSNYTMVFTYDKKFLFSKTLKIMESRISSEKFMKISRGLVINKLYITDISLGNISPYVQLINGSIFPISRRLQVKLRNEMA